LICCPELPEVQLGGPIAADSDRRESRSHDATNASRDPLAIPPEIKAGIRILLVDDERTLRESCASVLQMDGFSVTLAGRGQEALELLRQRKFDIMLVDLYMSQVSGLELLKRGLEANRDMIVVVMTGNPSVSSSIEALRAGAWDYLPKPFSATHLQVLIGRASHAVMVNREASALRQQVLEQHNQGGSATLIGISPLFRKAVELARKVAPTDASVFISGESGTGKEVFAQFIHEHSRRSKKPMVPINCAALPEPLLESEMFGHRKGAFTGADRDKPGLLETANGGTLFLDELTEMPMAIQAKLLRVIQDGVVRRVGSESTDAHVDVRFISATNRDPQQAVDAGVLRGDLFYRLRVVPITLPPLRKRQEDIPLLANHFLTYYWHRHRQMPDRCPRLSEESIAFLRSRPWRGNVRELQNVIEHAAVLLEPDQTVQPGDIPLYEESGDSPGEGGPGGVGGGGPVAAIASEPYHLAKDRVVAQFEKEYLTALVARASNNMSKAARLAGVDRTTLYRLMEKHQLVRSSLEDSGG
jgi:DNA-binding NtrC family response regulator